MSSQEDVKQELTTLRGKSKKESKVLSEMKLNYKGAKKKQITAQ